MCWYVPIIFCMEWFEVLIVGISAVSCTGICAWAWYQSQVRAAVIQQQGIDRREAARQATGSTTSPYNKQEWWVPLVQSALQNPQIMNMVLQKVAPALANQPGQVIKTE
jgi:hypothetical protein